MKPSFFLLKAMAVFTLPSDDYMHWFQFLQDTAARNMQPLWNGPVAAFGGATGDQTFLRVWMVCE